MEEIEPTRVSQWFYGRNKEGVINRLSASSLSTVWQGEEHVVSQPKVWQGEE
jgi:hypothetical protein